VGLEVRLEAEVETGGMVGATCDLTRVMVSYRRLWPVVAEGPADFWRVRDKGSQRWVAPRLNDRCSGPRALRPLDPPDRRFGLALGDDGGGAEFDLDEEVVAVEGSVAVDVGVERRVVAVEDVCQPPLARG